MAHALFRPFSLLALTLLPALAFAQTSTLDKIKQSGTMTLAYRESSIPFSYLDDKAQPTGFGYEICEKIADRVKAATGRNDLKKQYQAVTSANRPVTSLPMIASRSAISTMPSRSASRSPGRPHMK